ISAGTITANDHRDRSGQDLEIQPKASFHNVSHVQLPADIERRRLAAANLPKSGNARLAAQNGFSIHSITFKLYVAKHPRANEAHAADQDINQLRQLVEARPAEPETGASNTRVIGDLEVFTIFLEQGGIRE